MTGRTIEFEGGRQRYYAVLNGHMTLIALDVPLGDVNAVQHRGILEFANVLRLVVTVETARLRHGSGARGDGVVARDTGHQIFDILRVIHNHTRLRHQTPRRRVTPSTTRHGITHSLALEVTQEAGCRCYREVIPLHDLRVTTRAT